MPHQSPFCVASRCSQQMASLETCLTDNQCYPVHDDKFQDGDFQIIPLPVAVRRRSSDETVLTVCPVGKSFLAKAQFNCVLLSNGLMRAAQLSVSLNG